MLPATSNPAKPALPQLICRTRQCEPGSDMLALYSITMPSASNPATHNNRVVAAAFISISTGPGSGGRGPVASHHCAGGVVGAAGVVVVAAGAAAGGGVALGGGIFSLSPTLILVVLRLFK